MLNSTIVFICFCGLCMPILILAFNRGYKNANRYLAGFLFFASLYLLEVDFFFYGESLDWMAFFFNTHPFFYLISPFSYFYVRSILRDNTIISKFDFLHFIPFVASLIGVIPFWLTPWNYKLEIAMNLKGDDWDIAQYHINKILPHKVDQLLSILQIYFYAFSLWVLMRRYTKKAKAGMMNVLQYKLIRKWLFLFVAIFSIIAVNFSIVMTEIWIFHDKTEFLKQAEYLLLFASFIYVCINLSLLSFPQIMYGLPLNQQAVDASIAMVATLENSQSNSLSDETSTKGESPVKVPLQLFSDEYIGRIREIIRESIALRKFLNPEFSLTVFSEGCDLPSHHITYFFNNIEKVTFVEWRNKLRIEHAIGLMQTKAIETYTLGAISEQCGFSSQNTFIRAFKNVTGKTPSEYFQKAA